MVNDLVRNTPVVLQDIEIGGAAGSSNFLCDGLDGVVSVSRGNLWSYPSRLYIELVRDRASGQGPWGLALGSCQRPFAGLVILFILPYPFHL